MMNLFLIKININRAGIFPISPLAYSFIVFKYMYLTHLSRMNFPISIGRTGLFQILGVLVVFFIFIQTLI